MGVLGGIAMAAVRGSKIERVGTIFTLMTRAAPSILGGDVIAEFICLPVEIVTVMPVSVRRSYAIAGRRSGTS